MAEKNTAPAPVQSLKALQIKLLQVLEENRVPETMLKTAENKGTVSLFLRSDLICRFMVKGDNLTGLAVGKQFAAFVPEAAGQAKPQGEMLRFDFSPEFGLRQWQDTLCNICESRIDGIPKAFDCCHRYMECSECGACTNPDRAYAMECGYKKMLKKGKIFYGSRRNTGAQP